MISKSACINESLFTRVSCQEEDSVECNESSSSERIKQAKECMWVFVTTYF